MTETTLTPKSGALETAAEGPLSRVYMCYQCKKCSSGCPIADTMDIKPHQMMRLLQLGQDDTALNSETIWICASCETCTTRCPNDIEIAEVMDELRAEASTKGCAKNRNVERFHKVFLTEVKTLGRVHELSMIGTYKMFSREWFKDTVLGMKMFMKRKLKIFPKWIRGRREVRKLFKLSEKKER